jgi:Holliday junction resolvasome RuvABC ATP-dependent DNA helicase subunit
MIEGIMDKDEMFKGLVGQSSVKRKLSFYNSAFERTSLCPFLLFAGAKGLGKTEFAKAFAHQLHNKSGSKRPLLELNCSTLQNVDGFFEQVFLPIVNNNEVSILFDEAHELPKDLTNAFLTIFNTESATSKEFIWQESICRFDFERQTYMFATTETDKLFPPLKDRLTVVDFEPYSYDELSKIMALNIDEDIKIADEALQVLSKTVRGNARNAVKRAKEVHLYCQATGNFNFGLDEVDKLSQTLDILPFGISRTEKEILQILYKDGSCTLTSLSAKTGLSKTALMQDHEMYLLRKSFMEIDGKRKLTPNGRKVINGILEQEIE